MMGWGSEEWMVFAVFEACVGGALAIWLAPLFRGRAGVPELTRCERCGKPVVLEAMTYHRRRCVGLLRSAPEFSAHRRAW